MWYTHCIYTDTYTERERERERERGAVERDRSDSSGGLQVWAVKKTIKWLSPCSREDREDPSSYEDSPQPDPDGVNVIVRFHRFIFLSLFPELNQELDRRRRRIGGFQLKKPRDRFNFAFQIWASGVGLVH